MSEPEKKTTEEINLFGDTAAEQWINSMAFTVTTLVLVAQNGSTDEIEEVRDELIRCITNMGKAAEKAGVFSK